MTRALRRFRPRALVTIGLLALAIAPSVTAQDAKPQNTKGVSLGSSNTLLLEDSLSKRHSVKISAGLAA